jgi:hypothetical protein
MHDDGVAELRVAASAYGFADLVAAHHGEIVFADALFEIEHDIHERLVRRRDPIVAGSLIGMARAEPKGQQQNKT